MMGLHRTHLLFAGHNWLLRCVVVSIHALDDNGRRSKRPAAWLGLPRSMDLRAIVDSLLVHACHDSYIRARRLATQRAGLSTFRLCLKQASR